MGVQVKLFCEHVPYLQSASAVVIHYEEGLRQVYAPLPLSTDCSVSEVMRSTTKANRPIIPCQGNAVVKTGGPLVTSVFACSVHILKTLARAERTTVSAVVSKRVRCLSFYKLFFAVFYIV